MFEQRVMDAVDRAEKLLIETQDPVSTVLLTIFRDIENVESYYGLKNDIKKAFKEKHGMAMATYRESKTGLSQAKALSLQQAELDAPKIEIAKRLLANTRFNVAECGMLSGLGKHLAPIFKRNGHVIPKTYRLENFQKKGCYTQQKAERRRIHINGGMRIQHNSDKSVSTWLVLNEQQLPDNVAVLSVSIMGLSFNVEDRISRARMTVDGAINLKTGFLVPMTEPYSESDEVVLRVDHDQEVIIKASYDCVHRVLGLEFSNDCVPSRIEFTALFTTTEL